MKKIVTTLLCGGVLCAAFALGACASAEERFELATQSFNNYTVHVTMKLVDDSNFTDNYSTVLEVDGNKAKVTMSYDESYTQTIYYKEEQGNLYCYTDARNGWLVQNYRNIEEAVAERHFCYIKVFRSVFYHETEEKDGYFYLKEGVLATYSKTLGITLTSAKFKLKGKKFTAAEAIGATSGGDRFQTDYTFSKYDSTSVKLPDQK